MIIKPAKFKKVKEVVKRRISNEVYGCDRCKKEIGEEYLGISIFFSGGDSSERQQLCSWECVIKQLIGIKSDYFFSLPYVSFDNPKKPKGQRPEDLIEILKTIKFPQRSKKQ